MKELSKKKKCNSGQYDSVSSVHVLQYWTFTRQEPNWPEQLVDAQAEPLKLSVAFDDISFLCQ